jgi:uncharacterized protein
MRYLAAVLLLGLVSPAWAENRTGDIKDGADLFSKTAKQTARPILDDIHRHNKEFVVETFARPGPSLPDNNEKWGRIFFDWASERARAEKVNGVYLLICKEPPRFSAVVGTNTKKKAFTDSDRKELDAILLANLEKKDFDGALIEGATFVRDRMRHNLGGDSAVAHHGHDEYGEGALGGGGNSWVRWVWIGLAVLLGIWIVRALLVAMSGAGGAGGGAGGGFFSSFLGGLFGAAAGMWIYDSFFNHGGGNSWGGGDTTGGGGVDGSNQPDTDYSGDDGHDYGGGGGDDFGGGDFGGGGGDDFGGGDFGGGDY